MSRGIYKISIISWKQTCHRNDHFGHGIFSMVPLNLFENNLAINLQSILTNYNLSLYITYRFLEIYFLLFVCDFSLIWRRHHCRWRAANFDLCSALMAIEQWGFFSVPHLFCDTGCLFIMFISKDPWNSHRLPNV